MSKARKAQPKLFMLRYKRETHNIRGAYKFSVTKIFHDESTAWSARSLANRDVRNSEIRLERYKFEKVVE